MAPFSPNVLIESPGVQYGLENCQGGAGSPSQCRFDGTSLIDLFEAQNVIYLFYAEDYQGGCDLSALASSVPALHSTKVQDTPQWCEKVVNAVQFQEDVNRHNLTQIWFYSPSKQNGGGSGISPNQSRCTSTLFVPLLEKAKFSKDLLFVLSCTSSPPSRPLTASWSTALADHYLPHCPLGNGLNPQASPASSSRVWTGLAGGALGTVAQGASWQDDTPYNPFSITRTLKNNWILGALGKNDTRAELIYLGQLPKPAEQQHA